MIDSEPLWHEIESAVALRHGGHWTTALSHECIGTGLEHAVVLMRERLGVELGIEQGVAELVSCFIARVGELDLMPGCRELVDAGYGKVPLGLCSSSAPDLVRAVLDRFDLSARFAAVVSGASVAHAKPAPDIFLHAARLLGVAPASCVVLEDAIAGVAAGRAAGMCVIAVPERHEPRFAELADYVVRDLHEARALLEL